MMLGEVDNVDGHYIATRFYGLCIPARSMYVTGYSSERSGRVTRMSWSGVPVKFNVKSALLVYPRVWLWFLAFAWPFILHMGQNVNTVPKSTWITMGVFVAIAIASNFVGGVSSAEKNRLRILGKVTGLRVDPSKLQKWTREEKRDFWDKELGKMGIPTTPDGIRAAARSLPPDALAPLYAFACYSGDGPDWRSVAAEILPRIPPVPRFTPPIPNIR